jgi:predicted nucleotidyltransferase
MNDGLKAETRRQIQAVLAANPRVQKAILFGSRAMGTFSATSDIDLALVGPELTLNDQAQLATALADLSIAQTVDLVLLNQIESEELLAHIQDHGVAWL